MFYEYKNADRETSVLKVREEGLEPSHLCGATPSRWCVYHFRHSRITITN